MENSKKTKNITYFSFLKKQRKTFFKGMQEAGVHESDESDVQTVPIHTLPPTATLRCANGAPTFSFSACMVEGFGI